MNTYQAFLLYSTIITFLLLQVSCVTIGNRQFSMYYQSHSLIKRVGILKIIYFKPKHFHRYSIWEVLFFFGSYIQLFIFILAFSISFLIDISRVVSIFSLIFMALAIISEFARIIYIDITRKAEEKYMKNSMHSAETDFDNQERKAVFDYSKSTRFKLERLYQYELSLLASDDLESIEIIDEKYIGYFRNYKDIVFEDDEDK